MSRSALVIQNASNQFAAGKREQAKATLRAFLQKQPGDAEANKVLGMMLGQLEENEPALFYIQRAVGLAPGDAQLRFMIGNLYMILKRHKEAAQAYSECLRIAPGFLGAHDGRAKCLISLGDYQGAVECYEAGIAAVPDHPNSYTWMAAAMSIIGRMPEALSVLRRGIDRLPSERSLHEALCYQMNFADDVDPSEHLEAHRRLGALVAALNPPPAHPAGRGVFVNSREPERALRVAFVSADLCAHACALFLEGPIRALDRARVLPFCYSIRTEDDDATSKRFQGLAPWRSCGNLSDDEFAAQAAQDGIDIVIDASGWTDGHRLYAMVPRIAPIQMTYLGYPNTTGLPTMDYRIVDWHTDPAGAEAWCTEKLVRLPGCFVCFTPIDEKPEARLTPALEGDGGAPITFGSFNRLSKVRPAVARAWAEILRRVPNSRLLLKTSIVSEGVKAQYARHFEERGVSPDRVEWSGFVKGLGDHLAMYRRVDIALDSFPYNGTTTTCEATLMGVPVVALAGSLHRGRVGVSLLTAMGLPELIARDEEEYIRIAVGLAGDRARLAELHRTLRDRMLASPLCDAAVFARGLEGALWGVWREWCARPDDSVRT